MSRGLTLSEAEKKIFEAIDKNDVSTLGTLLVEKQNVNIVDENQMTPLQHAAYKGNKEMVQMLLDQGADVNLCEHQHGYTALHFSGLSGNADVCLLLLLAGAKPLVTNTVQRTPSQMAAFVGNHNCVATINNFVPKSEVDYYSTIRGQQTEASLPPFIADSFHKFIMQVNVHPVRVALHLQNFAGLADHLKEVQTVLELLRDKEMKRKDFNEVIAFKFHYLSSVVGKVIKLRSSKESDEKKADLTEQFSRKMLKTTKDGNSQEYMDEFLIECIREFPYRESTLFRQMVASLAGRGNVQSVYSVITGAINGQRGFTDAISICHTCGEEKPSKKCSKCKAVQYCDRNCQRLHWFAHKKACARLSQGGSDILSETIDHENLAKQIQNILKKQGQDDA